MFVLGYIQGVKLKFSLYRESNLRDRDLYFGEEEKFFLRDLYRTKDFRISTSNRVTFIATLVQYNASPERCDWLKLFETVLLQRGSLNCHLLP